MTPKKVFVALSTALLLAGAAHAQTGKTAPAETSKNASIPFADFRGQIDDWRAEGRDAILIKSSTGQWYRAEFMSPCNGLPFTETIGFPLDATRQVDKYSSILVRQGGGMREECHFKSFVEVPAPPKKKDDHKAPATSGDEHKDHQH